MRRLTPASTAPARHRANFDARWRASFRPRGAALPIQFALRFISNRSRHHNRAETVFGAPMMMQSCAPGYFSTEIPLEISVGSCE